MYTRNIKDKYNKHQAEIYSWNISTYNKERIGLLKYNIKVKIIGLQETRKNIQEIDAYTYYNYVPRIN